MFKSKWRKKYEKVMDRMYFWIDFHEKAQKTLEGSDAKMLYEIHAAQKIALRDMLRDMENIAKEN